MQQAMYTRTDTPASTPAGLASSPDAFAPRASAHNAPTRNAFACAALAAIAFLLPFTQAHAQSPAPVVTQPAALVELFTSEGCSSCPPADALLRQLNNTHTQDGTLVVGLSEHVTYWNRLGWTDPFSADTWTQRQQAYATRFHLESAYTPQAVVNGEHELVGSDKPALLQALQLSGNAARKAANTAPLLRILSTQRTGHMLHVRYAVDNAAAPSNTGIFAVIAADAAPSHVLRGENAGHTLNHTAVAQSLQRLGTVSSGAAIRTADIPIDIAAPAGVQPATQHLVFFAQEEGQGPALSVLSTPIQP